MSKIMLINVLQPEECRIAILENGVLEELYVERSSHESYVGNIYKGKIVNIEPSIQAAFIDFGVGRNGFLHVSDVEPAYYRSVDVDAGSDDEPRERGRNREREAPRERDSSGRGRDREPGRGRGRDSGRDSGRESGRGRDRDSGRGRDRDRQQSPPRHIPDVEDYPNPYQEALLQGTAPEQGVPGTDFASDLLDEPDAPLAEDFADDREDTRQDEADAVIETREVREVQQIVTETVESVSPTQDAGVDADAEPLRAHPETAGMEIEPEPRGRKRSRPSGRRRKPASAETTEEAGNEADPEKPPTMESAERRTHPGDEPEIGRLDPAGSDDDDLIFFSQPTTPVPTPPVERPAAVEEEEEEEVFEEEEEEIFEEEDASEEFEEDEEDEESEEDEEGEEEDSFDGPFADADEDEDNDDDATEMLEEPAPAPIDGVTEPPRRLRVQSNRSIEEELEADLRAAELGADAPPEIDPGYRVVSEGEFDEGSSRRRGGGGGRGRGDRGDRGDRRGGGGQRGRGGPRGGRDRGRTGSTRPGAGQLVRDKPKIETIFKRGQEVLVQVIKEGLGSKGPTLSTYISIAGRYLVLMPGLNRVGVSRKIEDEEARRRLRDIFNELRPPRGLGFIIRTAGMDKDRKELQRDLVYLSRLWQVVVRRIKKSKAPAEIYQESEVITRTIRDTFTNDITAIIVDEKAAFERAQEFLQIVMPRYADRIQLYDGKEPLFHKYRIEDEISRLQVKKVPLPMGGSIVIEQTEALVAIDVNSGNFRASDNNAEETAYQMNLQAAREIARQLRLRDLGGVIVNDFIDMREEKHRRGVEKALRDALSRDRARTKTLKMSAFGIIEMTRQRIRPSLKRSVFQDCQYCKGHGQVKTPESMSLEVIRMLQLAANRPTIQRIEVGVSQAVADYLLNRKRREITEVEQQGNIQVQINGKSDVPPELLEFTCYDTNGNEVRVSGEDQPQRPMHRR